MGSDSFNKLNRSQYIFVNVSIKIIEPDEINKIISNARDELKKLE